MCIIYKFIAKEEDVFISHQLFIDETHKYNFVLDFTGNIFMKNRTLQLE